MYYFHSSWRKQLLCLQNKLYSNWLQHLWNYDITAQCNLCYQFYFSPLYWFLVQYSEVQCNALQRKTLQWIFIRFREVQCTTLESNLLQYAHPSTPKCSWQLLILCYKIYSCWNIRTQHLTKNIHRLDIKLLHSARGAVQSYQIWFLQKKCKILLFI